VPRRSEPHSPPRTPRFDEHRRTVNEPADPDATLRNPSFGDGAGMIMYLIRERDTRAPRPGPSCSA